MTAIDPNEATTTGPASPRRRGTGSPGTRVLGVATVVSMAWLVAFGLGFSPADRDQEEAVRILYVHVPTIWTAYLAFVVTALASGMYLFRRHHSLGWDRLAGASAEIGVVFVGVVAFTLLYVWLVLHRTRAMAMEDLLDDRGLDRALAARRAEAGEAAP